MGSLSNKRSLEDRLNLLKYRLEDSYLNVHSHKYSQFEIEAMEMEVEDLEENLRWMMDDDYDIYDDWNDNLSTNAPWIEAEE